MNDAAAQFAWVRELFDGVAEHYDQSGVPFFGPIAQGLVDALDPRPGERALDAGCGRGAVTFRLAEAVGPTGHVDAIDLSAEMVSRTAARARAEGLSQVTVGRHDAGDPPGADYDLVASSLVLFFLPDPVATLQAWCSALAPGGRVGATTFRPWTGRWLELQHVSRAHAVVGAPPPPFSPRDPWDRDDRVADLFTRAGLADVTTVGLVHPLPLRDAAEFERFSVGTAVRGLWLWVDPAARDAFSAEVDRLFDSWRDDDGLVRLPVSVRYTIGYRH